LVHKAKGSALGRLSLWLLLLLLSRLRHAKSAEHITLRLWLLLLRVLGHIHASKHVLSWGCLLLLDRLLLHESEATGGRLLLLWLAWT